MRLRDGIRLGGGYAAPGTDVRAWKADLTVRTARSADVLAEMRRWRDEHAPGVTTSAITFAAFVGALQHLGLNPDTTGGIFLADARRYLPEDSRIDSNFCWGQFLSPADLTDPKAIHTTLKAELGTGRMLTMMALREGKLAVLGGAGMPAPYPTQAPVDVRPRITFSNQGRHDVLADLPWSTGPAGRVNHSIPTLTGPEGLTITTSEMNGVLHVEALFHASTFDPAVVARALELLCQDPAALIMART
jgi:hypothetical protein